MTYTKIPPSPPNPHIYCSPIPQDTSLQPQWIVSPEVQIKAVDYPYNYIHEFSVTYYSVNPVKENDVAYLYGPGNEILSSANVNSLGESLSFDRFTYYPLRVTFILKENLTSPDVKVTIPNELFAPESPKELYFKFSDAIILPDTTYQV